MDRSHGRQRAAWNLRRHRECSNCEQGRLGAELWAERHQVRLRAEVDKRIKQLRTGKPFLMR